MVRKFQIKKSLSTLLLVVGLCISSISFAQCSKLPKKKIKQILGSAIYDNHRSTDVVTTENAYIESYQIDLFRELIYKLIFDVTKIPEGVVIKVYDIGGKNITKTKREVVFDSSKQAAEDGYYEMVLKFPQKKLLISYEVLNETSPGCISFVLGYYYTNRK